MHLDYKKASFLRALIEDWHRPHLTEEKDGVHISFDVRSVDRSNNHRKARHEIVLRQRGSHWWRDDLRWRWYQDSLADTPILGIGIDFTSEDSLIESWLEYETAMEAETARTCLNEDLLELINRHTQFAVEGLWFPLGAGEPELYGFVRTTAVPKQVNRILRAEYVDAFEGRTAAGTWTAHEGVIRVLKSYRGSGDLNHLLLHELGHAFHHHMGQRDLRTAVIHELEAELFAVKASFDETDVAWISHNLGAYAVGMANYNRLVKR